MKDNEKWVPFEPLPTDVVSTKNRTTNRTHPGNIYFTQLINKTVLTLDPHETDFRKVAEPIVKHLMHDRGGRFLKPPDGEANPNVAVNLDEKRALGKVIHALKTAQLRQEKEIHGPEFMKKKKQKSSPQQSPNKEKSTESAKLSHTPKQRTTRRSAEGSSLYKVKMGSVTLSQYTMTLIAVVCNQTDLETAHQILDHPLGETLNGSPKDSAEEPAQLRLERLQMRHRFASAAAMGMSPVEFAEKLLKLWDAKLILVKKKKGSKRDKKTSTVIPGKALPVPATSKTDGTSNVPTKALGAADCSNTCEGGLQQQQIASASVATMNAAIVPSGECR